MRQDGQSSGERYALAASRTEFGGPLPPPPNEMRGLPPKLKGQRSVVKERSEQESEEKGMCARSCQIYSKIANFLEIFPTDAATSVTTEPSTSAPAAEESETKRENVTTCPLVAKADVKFWPDTVLCLQKVECDPMPELAKFIKSPPVKVKNPEMATKYIEAIRIGSTNLTGRSLLIKTASRL